MARGKTLETTDLQRTDQGEMFGEVVMIVILTGYSVPTAKKFSPTVSAVEKLEEMGRGDQCGQLQLQRR
jgi:hypothetical protein